MTTRQREIGSIVAQVIGGLLTLPLLPWAFIITGMFIGAITAGILAIPAAVLGVVAAAWLGVWAGKVLFRLAADALERSK